MPAKGPRAAIVAIGSELLDGRIADTNSQRLDARLARLGFEVAYHLHVADRLADIESALRFATDRAQVVILSGGLGPTEDDITRDAVARLAGQQLRIDEAALAHVRMIFDALGRPMSKNNERQALMPEGVVGLPNPAGTAFGFALDLTPVGGIGDARLYALPGVPRELDVMFDQQVAPQLEQLARAFGAPARSAETLTVFGMSESALDEAIADLCRDVDPSVSLNVSVGTVRITVTATGADRDAAAAVARERADAIAERLGRRVVARDGKDLPEIVAGLLLEKNRTLALAESCTGGMVSSLLTAIPGISGVFREGIVSYANEAKVERLGVSPELLEEHGAVSAECAQAMARGARERAGTDVAVSITGIAGPDGGTAEKPVGLVYFCVDAAPAGPGAEPYTETLERRFGALGRGPNGRDRVRRLASMTALDRLRVHLLGV